MLFRSTNPATGLAFHERPGMSAADIERCMQACVQSGAQWASINIVDRVYVLRKAAEALRAKQTELAALITAEMGKLRTEALAEVEKCATGCDYYADNAERLLALELVASDASRSYVAYQPLGAVLAIMPWNFPMWQVMRFALPALVVGNCVLLKHAPNVPKCASALQSVFEQAGMPKGVLQSLFIDTDQTQALIADSRIHGVTLTGSTRAGRAVAATAEQYLKKTVLELGGSDAFVVLDDADMEKTVHVALASRFQNCGQSCIAAKRFIVVASRYEEFRERFVSAVRALRVGDPAVESTTLAPMARDDLRETLHRQVQDTVQAGARRITGGGFVEDAGFFYQPTVLEAIPENSPAWCDELFGPVASLFNVRDDEHALELANATHFGLGGSVWTQDIERGERFALRMQCGAVFVNGLVKSDPRLPFGGVKNSGYGRELGVLGLREFVNAKTLWLR